MSHGGQHYSDYSRLKTPIAFGNSACEADEFSTVTIKRGVGASAQIMKHLDIGSYVTQSFHLDSFVSFCAFVEAEGWHLF